MQSFAGMSKLGMNALIALLVAGAASSVVACSKEEEKKTAWRCNNADIPMGEVTRCTQMALGDVDLGWDAVTSGYLVGSAVDTSIVTAPGGTIGTIGSEGAIPGTTPITDTSTAGGGAGGAGSGTSTGDTGTGGAGGGSTTQSPTTDTGTASSVDYPGWIVYTCVPGSVNPDCAGLDDSIVVSAPLDDTSVIIDRSTTGGAGSTDSTGDTGDTGGGGAGSTSGGTSGGPIGDTGSTSTGPGKKDGCEGNNGKGNGGAGGNNGNGPNGDTGTSSSGKGPGPNGGSGGTSKIPGPDECEFVPDLPYCGGNGGGAGSGASSSGSNSDTGSSSGTSSGGAGGNGNGNGNGSGNGGASSSGAPGQEKKNGGDDTGTGGASSSGSSGASSSGSSTGSSNGSSGSSNKGKSWKCIKDNKGNKACESVPSCPPGSHASNGACVEDEPNAPPGSPSSEAKPPSQGGCWITGGGFIIAPNDQTGAPPDGNGHDNFGGNAKGMKDGSVKGHWNHVDHGTQNHSKGRPQYIYCRHVDEPGPGQPGGKKGFTMNQAYFGGPAEWRDAASGLGFQTGYWFDVVVKDHGEPGSVPHAKNGYMVDTYHFTIRKMDDPVNLVSGKIVYEVGRGGNKASGGLVGGNIQLHPPNGGHPYTPGPLPAWVGLED